MARAGTPTSTTDSAASAAAEGFSPSATILSITTAARLMELSTPCWSVLSSPVDCLWF